MSRLIIGEALSARLHAAEAAIDQAMADTAALAAALPAARLDAGLAGHHVSADGCQPDRQDNGDECALHARSL